MLSVFAEGHIANASAGNTREAVLRTKPHVSPALPGTVRRPVVHPGQVLTLHRVDIWLSPRKISSQIAKHLARRRGQLKTISYI